MPTKRELIGGGGPSDGFQWSDVRWHRIGAFVGGIVCCSLYFRLDPFQFFAGWIAISLASIPIGLVFYGCTEQSWQSALKFTVAVGVGTGLSPFLASLNFAFLP